jgi:hypothetical protein
MENIPTISWQKNPEVKTCLGGAVIRTPWHWKSSLIGIAS